MARRDGPRLNAASRLVTAGAVYWIIVFTFAFTVGVLRVLVVAPRLGDVAAVVLETPLVLAVSWVASHWTMRRLNPPTWGDALAVGAIAFGLLMCAELSLSVFAFGRPPADWLARFRTASGAIGLAAQVAFGFVPFVQRATHRP